MAEFIILDETASTDTQNIVEGYLAHKWGLSGSLPSGHAYKSTVFGRHHLTGCKRVLAPLLTT